MKKIFNLILFSGLFMLLITACNSSSCPEDMYMIEKASVEGYHSQYFAQEPVSPPVESFSIYLDYSGSMKTAFKDPQTAAFYNIFINSLKISQVDFYDVDKNDVTLIENLSKSDLYTKIKDFNRFTGTNAPLDKAIALMAQQNGEAVLITDGELWNERERNDPWAREVFGEWLKAGNTIEFFVTNHIESGKQKHLYYIFFVPKQHVGNNESIAEQLLYYLTNSIDAKDLVYTHFSISNVGYKLVQEYATAKSGGVNTNASLNESTYINAGETEGFEFQEYYLTWKDLVQYIYNAYDANGNQIAGGDPLVSKLFVEVDKFSFFKIEEIGVKVFDVNNDFYSYLDIQRCINGTKPKFQLDENGEKVLDGENNPIVLEPGEAGCYDELGNLIGDTLFTPNTNLAEVVEVFAFDQESFMNNFREQGRGEIVLKIHENFNGSQINSECGNLHRVDVYLKKISPDSANENLNILSWQGAQVAKNTSLYDSVLGALNDANPEGNVIYSFYIKTSANDYQP